MDDIIDKTTTKYNLTANKKRFIKNIKDAVNDINTANVKSLKEIRDSVSNVDTSKINGDKVMLKTQADVLAKIDSMIILKSPKFTLPNKEGITQWAKENRNVIIASGVAVAVV